jgi:hypothetical protein
MNCSDASLFEFVLFISGMCFKPTCVPYEYKFYNFKIIVVYMKAGTQW